MTPDTARRLRTEPFEDACLSPALHPYVVSIPGDPDRRFSNLLLALETVQGRRGWRIKNELNGEVWRPGMMRGVA